MLCVHVKSIFKNIVASWHRKISNEPLDLRIYITGLNKFLNLTARERLYDDMMPLCHEVFLNINFIYLRTLSTSGPPVSYLTRGCIPFFKMLTWYVDASKKN